MDGAGPLGEEVIVGGQFTSIGGVSALNIARFDGSAWHATGSGISNEVADLEVVDLDGAGPLPAQLFAARTTGVVRWNGLTWTQLPFTGGTNQAFTLEAFDPDGPGPIAPKLAIGGRLTTGSPPTTTRPVWFWDGTTLTPAPGFASNEFAYALESFDPDGPAGPAPSSLYVAMEAAPHFRRVTATGWELPEGGELGPSSTVLQMFPFDEDGPGPGTGGLYLFSNFLSAGGVPSGFAARWGCPIEPVCSADWDHNGIVNSTDVGEFINDWFVDQAEGTLVTDFDGNGVVNSTDVGEFINAYFEQTALGCG